MAICGGATCTLTVMGCPRYELCGMPLVETYPFSEVLEGGQVSARQSRFGNAVKAVQHILDRNPRDEGGRAGPSPRIRAARPRPIGLLDRVARLVGATTLQVLPTPEGQLPPS